MNILLVSQCSKNALKETRRVLDQFAERKGDRTWQTTITQQGLVTLRKMLRKSARRNTAVACHWIKSGNRSELLWIVGKLQRFNDQGTVPTNTTRRDILRSHDENSWQTAEAISLLAGIAGLFHDFGKANALFQSKLTGQSGSLSEPFRHEWVSLRLFQAFVGEGRGDHQWLERLAKVSGAEEKSLLQALVKDTPDTSPNPFTKLPPLAKTVGWLLLSHHKLPKYAGNSGRTRRQAPPIERMEQWLTGMRFHCSWNSPQVDSDWRPAQLKAVWEFKKGTPLRSQTWCEKAQGLGKRALKHNSLYADGCNWLEDRFTSHLARLCLMLADHCYSASDPQAKWQDLEYKAYANTDRETRRLKQQLDEHNVGVGHNAFLLAKSLPKLRQSLPSISRHKAFKRRGKIAKFRWQDKAYDLTRGLNEKAFRQGFFGVNMASTGCGKTFANARIMYALADEKLGCRFNVALGLRTLTLQTGDALRERLHLDTDDLGVLIGSQAVSQLHEMHKMGKLSAKSEVPELTAEEAGSESAENLLERHQYVRYDGSLDDGRLSQWLAQSGKLHQLLSAPVLVSTIDHLIPATEGERGGKQIAPMLRLLTSDLVLDEPDDFGLEDMPALTRLVNWAGLLGARVVLSSATLPPALIGALFDAYSAGRRAYNRACGEPGQEPPICCGWFDEFSAIDSECVDEKAFVRAHTDFVAKRLSRLAKQRVLRRAELLEVSTERPDRQAVDEATAEAVWGAIHRLHRNHHGTHPESGQRVSIGLVRMANIDPMVAVTQRLLSEPPPDDCRVHFCVYHSRYPLVVRSNMEAALDRVLDRHDSEDLWRLPEVQRILKESPEKHHLFVVFATAVAEVGRDHDYDWAVVEPSSMRSLIQLAGRIQRHRQVEPQTPNMLVLNRNMKALQNRHIAFDRPGFESDAFCLSNKNLQDLLEPSQYRAISAGPRIQPRQPLSPDNNLVDLEHAAIEAQLYGCPEREIVTHASLWWQNNPTWCAEMQRRTPFRRSSPDEEFVLYMEEEGEEPEFHRFSEKGELLPVEREFDRPQWQPAERVEPWMENNLGQQIEELADIQNMEISEISIKFARVRLPEYGERASSRAWRYHPWFGVYRILT